VAGGLSNAEIAAKIFVSVGTVKTHLGHIYTKLCISGRAALAVEAVHRQRAGP
jgi:DNA-binding NarL/FixJ family response regulator